MLQQADALHAFNAVMNILHQMSYNHVSVLTTPKLWHVCGKDFFLAVCING